MKESSGDKHNSNTSRRREFEQLTRRHIDSMWRTATRITGSRDAAADLVQDACLKAYVAFDQFEQGTNYKAWIFRILTNLCRDYLRREKLSPVTDWDYDKLDTTLAINTQETNRPDLQLQQGQFYTDAVDAMAALSPDVRLIVCLSILEGLTYQEIAIAANIPIGTVRSRLSSGRKRLKSLLKVHTEVTGEVNSLESDLISHETRNSRHRELRKKSPLMLPECRRTELQK